MALTKKDFEELTVGKVVYFYEEDYTIGMAIVTDIKNTYVVAMVVYDGEFNANEGYLTFAERKYFTTSTEVRDEVNSLLHAKFYA